MELTSLGVQIHGGMGYIEETGAAQHFRDSRIAPIYEGTNGIQAADLVGRKLPVRGGAVGAGVAGVDRPARRGAGRGRRRAGRRARQPRGRARPPHGRHRLGAGAHRHLDPTTRSAASTPYLKQFGYVLCGWLLAKAALAARRLLGEELGGGFDAEFLRAKIATARFYATNVLPQAGGLLGAVTAGSDDLFAIEPKYLAG